MPPVFLELGPCVARSSATLHLYAPWALPERAWKRRRQWGKKGIGRNADGRLVEFFDFFDKDADRRIERITDVETGEIIHEIDHPLSEHRGHGSAKFKRE